MKKTMTMMAVMLCCIISAWGVELTAPTYPNWVAPTADGTYYLYNVEADKWLAGSTPNSNYVGVQTTGKAVLMQYDSSKDCYHLKWADSNNWWDAAFSDRTISGYYSTSLNSNYDSWTIQHVGDGTYHIQIASGASYYNADQWLGWGGETTSYVYTNRASDGNIT